VAWKRTRWFLIFAVAGLLAIKQIILPVGAAALWSGKYMEQVLECDTAMEASWYFRQDNRIPAESEVVQLLACHNYDKTRKLMLSAGLPESYLAWLGLRSLEIYQRPAEEFARQHRFTQR